MVSFVSVEVCGEVEIHVAVELFSSSTSATANNSVVGLRTFCGVIVSMQYKPGRVGFSGHVIIHQRFAN